MLQLFYICKLNENDFLYDHSKDMYICLSSISNQLQLGSLFGRLIYEWNVDSIEINILPQKFQLLNKTFIHSKVAGNT